MGTEVLSGQGTLWKSVSPGHVNCYTPGVAVFFSLYIFT